MLIRPITPEDTPARVVLHRACISYSLATEELLDSESLDPAARKLRLAAELDGQLVATGVAGLDLYGAEGDASANILVAPEHRGKGVGSALYRRLEPHLAEIGARTVIVSAFDDAAVGFASRRGFTPKLATRVSEADPRPLTPLPVPAGIDVRALADLPDLRAAHEVALTFGPDIPSSTPYVPLPYDKWVAARRRSIGLDLDCSFLAFDGERPVALTLAGIVGTRMVSLLTGTHPDHRRRGLARLVKTASLSAAAAKGVTHAYTFNGEENARMLGVNDRLGYRPHLVVRELVRELSVA